MSNSGTLAKMRRRQHGISHVILFVIWLLYLINYLTA